MNKLTITLITLLLTACGGGSGGSGEQPTNSTNSTSQNVQAQSTSDTQSQTDSAQEQPAEEPADAEGMEAVVVDESFNFSTDVPVSVSVGPDVVSSRAFINICQQEATLTNDENCFLRAPIDSTGLTVEILLPHSEQKLKAEIWYYSTSIEPMVFTWEFDQSLESQQWKIN
ncbi:hypothetical protein [Pseudoalteromonas luteoviolacea]|uniref:Lipoprotein n=1 Tax=Pseudoalteromonas luteoviolacea S4060-1 TaxID=1365257 RepID=A0A167NU31_9GAMM|nr:hypothetical protein [Pseudoalteromonas luteoviolacea]KZN28517.1 hypothetical protein N480_10515 [Pseudoalteromonas luteoviolacea S2607]KZN68793.1 hypothetical protein N478_14110 [Pseudoalteromonas luteoviolacea S4060-1]